MRNFYNPYGWHFMLFGGYWHFSSPVREGIVDFDKLYVQANQWCIARNIAEGRITAPEGNKNGK